MLALMLLLLVPVPLLVLVLMLAGDGCIIAWGRQLATSGLSH